MKEPLNLTKLMDWLEGRLPKDEQEAVVAAVQADESYEDTVNWLRTFLNLSKSTVLIDPPAGLLREAEARFRAHVQGKQQAGWLQRLAARLASDSWQRPSLVGVRRTGLDAAPRQLVYTAETADIVLNTRAGSKDLFDLIGQVFPTDGTHPASFTVQLMLQEHEVALTYTDSIGKFIFMDLVAGAYMIIIRSDQAEITVADVELSA